MTRMTKCVSGGVAGRDLAALLARELTRATLRELSGASGLTHPDRVRSLIRRVDRAVAGSPALRAEVEAIRQRVRKTGKRT